MNSPPESGPLQVSHRIPNSRVNADRSSIFDFTSSLTNASRTRSQRRTRHHPMMLPSALQSANTTTVSSKVPAHAGSRACDAQPTCHECARPPRPRPRNASFYSSSALHERTGVLGRVLHSLYGLETPVSDTRASKVASFGYACEDEEPTFFASPLFMVAQCTVRTSMVRLESRLLYTRKPGRVGFSVRKGRGIIFRLSGCFTIGNTDNSF